MRNPDLKYVITRRFPHCHSEPRGSVARESPPVEEKGRDTLAPLGMTMGRDFGMTMRRDFGMTMGRDFGMKMGSDYFALCARASFE